MIDSLAFGPGLIGNAVQECMALVGALTVTEIMMTSRMLQQLLLCEREVRLNGGTPPACTGERGPHMALFFYDGDVL
jgi:hypothetical protein